MNDVTLRLEESLETLIDRHGVSAVLESIATVCHGKSDHIREAWQDDSLADLWTRVARRIGTACDSPPVRNLKRINGEK